MEKFEKLRINNIESSHEQLMADRELLMVNERPIDKQNTYHDRSNYNISLAIFNHSHAQSKKHIMNKLAKNE